MCKYRYDNAHFKRETSLFQQISAVMSPGVHKHKLTHSHFTVGRMKHSNCSIIMTIKLTVVGIAAKGVCRCSNLTFKLFYLICKI